MHHPGRSLLHGEDVRALAAEQHDAASSDGESGKH